MPEAVIESIGYYVAETWSAEAGLAIAYNAGAVAFAAEVAYFPYSAASCRRGVFHATGLEVCLDPA